MVDGDVEDLPMSPVFVVLVRNSDSKDETIRGMLAGGEEQE